MKAMKIMLKDGIRPATDVVFITWNKHPSYMKYIGSTITLPPQISRQNFSKGVEDGTININDFKKENKN